MSYNFFLCFWGSALPEKISLPFLQIYSNILDEVQTGGGPTGKMWCHEWFELPEVEFEGIFFHPTFWTFAGSRYCHLQQEGRRNAFECDNGHFRIVTKMRGHVEIV